MKITNLNPAPYNPRTISDEALRGLAASIKQFSASVEGNANGLYRLATTITVNRNGNRILSGHQRIRALTELLKQDQIHDDDITWVELEPDSALEKAVNVEMNNPHIAGKWTDGLDEMLLAIQIDMPGYEELRLDQLASLDVSSLSGESQMSGMEYRIVILCDSEQHQTELLEELESQSLSCKVLIS